MNTGEFELVKGKDGNVFVRGPDGFSRALHITPEAILDIERGKTLSIATCSITWHITTELERDEEMEIIFYYRNRLGHIRFGRSQLYKLKLDQPVPTKRSA